MIPRSLRELGCASGRRPASGRAGGRRYRHPTATSTCCEGDVLVVLAERGLGGRGEIGSGSRSPSRRPGGSAMPQTAPVALVVQPARAGQVAAGDSLDGQHLQRCCRAWPGRATADGIAGSSTASRWLATRSASWPNHHTRHRGQDAALVRNLGRQHMVKGRDPVAGHHQQPPVRQEYRSRTLPRYTWARSGKVASATRAAGRFGAPGAGRAVMTNIQSGRPQRSAPPAGRVRKDAIPSSRTPTLGTGDAVGFGEDGID